MKTSTISKTLGLLALLGSSASMAATINVTASTLAPVAGGANFTMTLTGDLSNVFAATIALSFDATKVSYVTGVGLGSFSVFVQPPSFPTVTSPTTFYIEVPAGSVSGAQSYAQLTFAPLAAGAANIVFSDDGGNESGWPDFTTSAPVIANYVNANVVVTPAPAALWLLGTGLAGLMIRSVRRKRAVA